MRAIGMTDGFMTLRLPTRSMCVHLGVVVLALALLCAAIFSAVGSSSSGTERAMIDSMASATPSAAAPAAIGPRGIVVSASAVPSRHSAPDSHLLYTGGRAVWSVTTVAAFASPLRI